MFVFVIISNGIVVVLIFFR